MPSRQFYALGGAYKRITANETAIAAAAHRPVMAPIAGGTSTFSFASNGTDIYVQTRAPYVAIGDISSLDAAFPNLSIGSNGEVTGAPTNNVAPIASVEYPSGVFTPIYFSGQRAGVIEPYNIRWTDPCDILIPKGATYWIRTYLVVTAGQVWWTQGYADGTITSEGGASGNTDKTLSGTISGSYNRPYGPVAIRSRFVPGDTLRIAGFGDSIVGAVGDSTNLGWFGRAFGAYQRVRFGMSGEKASAVPGTTGAKRLFASQGCNAAFLNYGTNDFPAGRTTAQITADLAAGYLARAQRGVAMYTATLVPRTTGTWADTAGQTVTAQESVRLAVNAWLRDGAPVDATTRVALATGATSNVLRVGAVGHPVKRVYEFADVCETARDSGFWRFPGFTTDGVHPADAGHAALAAAISVPQILADVGATS